MKKIKDFLYKIGEHFEYGLTLQKSYEYILFYGGYTQIKMNIILFVE